MNHVILQAYETLVPNDQLVIDAMISALATKDKQISNLVKDVHDRLDREKDAQTQEEETKAASSVSRTRIVGN